MKGESSPPMEKIWDNDCVLSLPVFVLLYFRAELLNEFYRLGFPFKWGFYKIF